MVIKATFKAGETSIKVNALHQWDYGQRLEIEAEDLPQIFEVHFACKDMTEAVVVSCAANDGVGIVTIPNRCLEQSKPITAWIYEIDGEQGTTTKTISIPIVARVRPSKTDEIPQGIHDKYTELITLVNDTLGRLESGEVVIGKAQSATNADYATSAGNASTAANATTANTARYATDAESCEAAQTAVKSVFAGCAQKLMTVPTTYENTDMVEINQRGLYMVKIKDSSGNYQTDMIYVHDVTSSNPGVTDHSCGRKVAYNSTSKCILTTTETSKIEWLALISDTAVGELYSSTMGG